MSESLLSRLSPIFMAALFMWHGPIAIAGGAELQERVHESFGATSDVAVRLENVSGRIVIAPTDANTIDVLAIKRAEDQDQLSNITVEISHGASPVSSVEVRTRYSHDGRGGSVDYTLTVPRHAQLRLSNVQGGITANGFAGNVAANDVSGDVSVENSDGSVQVHTVNGKIDVSLLHMGHDRRATLKTVNGAITLIVPRDSGAAVRISSLSGALETDFALGMQSNYVGKTARGKIGDGSGSIEMESVSGLLALKSSPGR
jgi:DUF4097 and DUF4098 domain-containing protein YvlB